MKNYLLICISCGLLFIACMPMINTFETAQTTPVNEFAGGIGISPYYFSIIKDEGANGLFWPISRITAKYGITDKFDIGIGALLTYWIPGIIVNTKYQLQKNHINTAVSFNSSFYSYSIGSVNASNTFTILNLQPAFIISREHENKFPFSLTLGIHNWLIYYRNEQAESYTNSLTSIFTNIGLPIRIGAKRSLRITPELGLLIPIFGTASLEGEDDIFTYQAGHILGQFGIYFGK